MAEFQRQLPSLRTYTQGRTPYAAWSPKREPESRPSALGAGLRAGWNEFEGLLNAATAGVGEAIGSQRLEDLGAEWLRYNQEVDAPQLMRADLEVAPWKEGGASVLPWLVYQAAKQAPIIGGAIGAGAVTGGLGAPAALGAGAFGTGVGYGAMSQEALEGDSDITPEEQRKAALLSIPYGLAEAAVPYSIGKLVGLPGFVAKKAATSAVAQAAGRKAAKSIGRKVIEGLGFNAIAEGATEGVQTAMENSFRPDLTSSQKAERVVDAMLTGGAVGGLFGAGGGAVGHFTNPEQVEELLALPPPTETRDLRGKTPDQVSNDELVDSVKAQIDMPGPEPRRALPAPTQGGTVIPPAPDAQALDPNRRAQRQSARAILPRILLRNRPIGDYDAQATRELGLSLAPKRTQGVVKFLSDVENPVDLARKVEAVIEERGEDDAPAYVQAIARRFGIIPTVDTVAGRQLDESVSIEDKVRFAGEAFERQKANREQALQRGEPYTERTVQDTYNKLQELVARKAINDALMEERQQRQAEEAANGPNLGEVVEQEIEADRAAAARARQVAQLRPETEDNAAQKTAAQATEIEGLTDSQRSRLNKLRYGQSLPGRIFEADNEVEPVPADFLSKFVLRGPSQEAVDAEAQRIKAGQGSAVRVAVSDSTKTAKVVNPEVLAAYQKLAEGAKGEARQAFKNPPTVVEGSSFGIGEVSVQKALAKDAEIINGRMRPSQVFQSLRPKETKGATPAQRRAETAEQPQGEELKYQAVDKNGKKVTKTRTVYNVPIDENNSVTIAYMPKSQSAPAGWYVVNRNRPPASQQTRGIKKRAGLDFRAGRIPTTADQTEVAAVMRRVQELVESGEMGPDSIIANAAAGNTDRYAGPRAGIVSEAMANQVTLDPVEVDARIQDIASGWTNTPNIEVVKNLSEIPGAGKADPFTPSLYRPETGTVYFVTSNLRNLADVAPLLYHEALVHFGLDQQFGKDLTDVLTDIYRTNETLQLAAETLSKMRDNPYKGRKDRRARLIEEVLATEAESIQQLTQQDPSILERLVVMFKKYARMLGKRFGVGELSYSAAEVASLVRISAASVRRGTRKPLQAGGLRYAMYPDDQPLVADTSTPAGLNKSVGKLMELMSSLRESTLNQAVEAKDAGFRRATLGARTLHDLARNYGHFYPVDNDPMNAFEVVEYGNQLTSTTASRFAEMINYVLQDYEQAMKETRNHELIGRIMGAAALELDVDRPWSDHVKVKANQEKATGWLKDLDADTLAERKRIHAELQANARTLKKTKLKGKNVSLWDVYKGFEYSLRTQITAQRLTDLHHAIMSNTDVVRLIYGDTNIKTPMERFLESKQATNYSPQATYKWFNDELQKLLTEVNKVSEKQQQDLKLNAMQLETTQLNSARNTLQDVVRRAKSTQGKLVADQKGGPYFHLGRFGNYFVSFNLKRTQDGKNVDQRALTELRDYLYDRGFEDVISIMPGTDTPRFYARFQTQQEAQNLVDTLADAPEGLFAEMGPTGHRAQHYDASKGIYQNISQLLSESDIRGALGYSDTLTDEEKVELNNVAEALRNVLNQAALDRMPDTAAEKLMQASDRVMGFSPDMVRSLAFRMQVGANALATSVGSYHVGRGLKNASEAVLQAQKEKSLQDATMMRNVLDEFLNRQSNRMHDFQHSVFDTIRAINHVWYLGLSPAYFLTNLTQIGVMLWPELAKRPGVGFGRSLGAIADATPLALRIAFRMLTPKEGSGFREHFSDGVISPEILADADPSLAVRQADGSIELTDKGDYVMRLVNTGALNIGAPTRELGRVVEGALTGTKTDNYLKYFGVLGLYSEVITRATAALASYDLDMKRNEKISSGQTQGRAYTTDDLVRRGSFVVHETMFNYSESNVARLFGRDGVLGVPTKLVMAFMQYPLNVMEKLFTEFKALTGKYPLFDASGMSGDEYQAAMREQQKAAGRFLVGHFTAVGLLAGSLGLPFVTIIAEMIEMGAEMFRGDEDEPLDVVTAYRNWLAGMLGKDMAEIVARGVPRAFNVDMSIRAGEQDLFPFSQFWRDERTWEEALQSLAYRGLGSPFAMGADFVSGFSKIAQGDILEGAKLATPIAMRNVAEAYRMGTMGYVDRMGRKMPMSVEGRDIAVQLLGFSTSEDAEYGEARFANIQRIGQIRREASSIGNKLATAIEQGDVEGQRYWMQKARQFDRANGPAYTVIPGMVQRLRNRARIAVMAPGVRSRRDYRGWDSVAFANY